jgi:hypothetical protein
LRYTVNKIRRGLLRMYEIDVVRRDLSVRKRLKRKKDWEKDSQRVGCVGVGSGVLVEEPKSRSQRETLGIPKEGNESNGFLYFFD